MRSTAEFDDFYAGSSARLLGQIYLVTGSRADAEDAVAEAYARAWQRWSHVRECDNPEAWVRQRQAIMLHHIVGLSVAEISAEIKVPDGTVKARLSRGRTTLARHLASLETQEAGHE